MECVAILQGGRLSVVPLSLLCALGSLLDMEGFMLPSSAVGCVGIAFITFHMLTTQHEIIIMIITYQ